MKLKEDILKWREEIRKLNKQVETFNTKSIDIYTDIQTIKNQVSALVKITEDMTETMLTLIRQQIGD